MTKTYHSCGIFGLILPILPTARAANAPAKTDKPAKTVEPAKQAIEIINVTIHPAAEPVPALKYHLLPTFLETTPGDAMPMYAKAMAEYVAISTRICDDPSQFKK